MKLFWLALVSVFALEGCGKKSFDAKVTRKKDANQEGTPSSTGGSEDTGGETGSTTGGSDTGGTTDGSSDGSLICVDPADPRVADVNRDGVVDSTDVQIVTSNMNSTDACWDDGDVEVAPIVMAAPRVCVSALQPRAVLPG